MLDGGSPITGRVDPVLEGFPFLYSYPPHEFCLTMDGARHLLKMRDMKRNVREATILMLTRAGGPVVCSRCGHSYWDMLLARDLEPTFGSACLPRPHVIKAIAKSGTGTLGEVVFNLLRWDGCTVTPSERDMGQLVRRLAEAHVSLWYAAGGAVVLHGDGSDKENHWLYLE